MLARKNELRKHSDRNKTPSNMKIVAIEGLDKAGKHTATQALYDYFTTSGLRVEKMSFPNYGTPIGQMIQKWLKGEILADEKTFELLQAADKQHAQTIMNEYERQGVDVLLIDRYVHTEWAYGAYENDEQWLAELTRHMRLPDAVIYLDVEPEVCMQRKGKHGDNDFYESDIERLRYTKNEFECLFEEQAEEIEVQIVDANQPPQIVTSQVLDAAGKLCRSFTGIPVEEDGGMVFATTDAIPILH